MGKNNVISLEIRQAIADPLTQTLQEGVKAFISQAVEAVLPELLTTHSERTMDDDRVAVVRNGYLPQRELQTGVGLVYVGTALVAQVATTTDEPRLCSRTLALYQSYTVLPVIASLLFLEVLYFDLTCLQRCLFLWVNSAELM